MTIDLDDIESRIKRTSENDYAWLLGTRTGAALVAEVERLRTINDDYLLEMGRQHALLRDQAREAKTERAAVVAWLRAQRQYGTDALLGQGFANVCGILAGAIERGEHRREGE